MHDDEVDARPNGQPVLVLEPIIAVRQVLVRVLRDWGFAPQAVESTSDMCASRDERPSADIVIANADVPQVLDWARAIRSAYPTVCFVLMSAGWLYPETPEWLGDAGIQLVARPFALTALRAALDACQRPL